MHTPLVLPLLAVFLFLSSPSKCSLEREMTVEGPAADTRGLANRETDPIQPVIHVRFGIDIIGCRFLCLISVP